MRDGAAQGLRRDRLRPNWRTARKFVARRRETGPIAPAGGMGGRSAGDAGGTAGGDQPVAGCVGGPVAGRPAQPADAPPSPSPCNQLGMSGVPPPAPPYAFEVPISGAPLPRCATAPASPSSSHGNAVLGCGPGLGEAAPKRCDRVGIPLMTPSQPAGLHTHGPQRSSPEGLREGRGEVGLKRRVRLDEDGEGPPRPAGSVSKACRRP